MVRAAITDKANNKATWEGTIKSPPAAHPVRLPIPGKQEEGLPGTWAIRK
jgi:hypothetical protein